MPTDSENVQYLYLVLTHGGVPTIDWDAVGAAMDLKKGAVAKRWSRLKKSMEQGETPTGTAYSFLWLCLKHSLYEGKTMKWDEIAKQCGTTAGAASKRYSRMKLAFEAGSDTPRSNPGTPAPQTPSKATPRKRKAAAGMNDDGEDTPVTTPKRKRASPKKKEVAVNPEPELEDDAAEDSEEDKKTPKKAKVSKAKATPKRKTPVKSSVIKEEHVVLDMQPTMAIKNEAKDDTKNTNENIFLSADKYVDDLVHQDNEDDDDQATYVTNGFKTAFRG